jgi:hypothetical protein
VQAARHLGLLAVFVAASLTACGTGLQPRSCSQRSDCATDAFCVDGYCLANRPPTARIVAPPSDSLFTNEKLAFDGSSSSDPDSADQVVGYAWTVAPASGACAAVPSTGDKPLFLPVFQCPGEYEVILVVADTLQTPSVPERMRIRVAAAVAPRVTTGQDLSLDHRCELQSGGRVCTPVDPTGQQSFQLSATGTGPASFSSYRWSYQPPPGVGAGVHVTFSPDFQSASPTVTITADGTAMAGTWKFQVTATDDRGLIATGIQSVTVGNRPPAITVSGPSIVSVPHRFNAAMQQFEASGTTSTFAFEDPDGDPVQATWLTLAENTGPDSRFEISDWNPFSFQIAVPYTKAADAVYLIGPAVTRQVLLQVSDVNGARSSAAWNVVVTNRPPRIAAREPPVYNQLPPDSRYLVDVTLFTAADDDGDPMTVDASTGDPMCTCEPISGGQIRVLCSGYDSHTITATVRDPWASAACTARLELNL